MIKVMSRRGRNGLQGRYYLKGVSFAKLFKTHINRIVEQSSNQSRRLFGLANVGRSVLWLVLWGTLNEWCCL